MSAGNLILLTPPTSEPVDDALLREHCKLEHELEANAIAIYLGAARQWVESYTKRQLLTATWSLELERWPPEIQLPRPPFQTATGFPAVKYLDADGALQTLASSEYEVDSGSEPAVIYPVYGTTWPTIRRQRRAVRASWKAGYASATSVPAGLKAAILLLAGARVLNREPTREEWQTVKDLCDPFRVGDDCHDYLQVNDS